MSRYSLLLKNYYNSDLNEQESLENQLIALKKNDVKGLLPFLSFSKESLMLTAFLLSEWVTLKIPEVKRMLNDLAKSDDLDIRFYAASGLARIGDLRGFWILKEFILQNYMANVKNYIPLVWIKDLLKTINYPESRYLQGMIAF